MRMAIISGPPAKPSFTGTGIPGIANGNEPKIRPRNIPTKIVAMLGAFNLTEDKTEEYTHEDSGNVGRIQLAQ